MFSPLRRRRLSIGCGCGGGGGSAGLGDTEAGVLTLGGSGRGSNFSVGSPSSLSSSSGIFACSKWTARRLEGPRGDSNELGGSGWCGELRFFCISLVGRAESGVERPDEALSLGFGRADKDPALEVGGIVRIKARLRTPGRSTASRKNDYRTFGRPSLQSF